MHKVNLVWPHETESPTLIIIIGRLLFPPNPVIRKTMAQVCRIALEIFANLPVVYLLHRQDPFQHVYEQSMALFNGRAAGFLANKFEFIETVNKLGKGYQTPRQILVQAHPPAAYLKGIIKTIHSWQVKKLYLKPVTGGNSRGIKVLGLQDLEKFLTAIGENYVVQEEIIFASEYRYAVSRGFDGVTRRLCYEKVRPRLTGDGKATLLKLILKDNDLPLHSKFFAIYNQRQNLGKVVGNGEAFVLTHVANPPRGSLERNIYDRILVSQLDSYFSDLINDLEQYLSAPSPWPLLCFDLGITDMSKVSKKTLVLIELQMPFSALVYFGRCRHRFASFLYFYYTALRPN